MAKKDKKKKDADARPDPADVVEAVRGAVERTFQATTGGADGARDRGRGLLDDVASAAQRIRESFDDLRVLEDVRGLRAEVDALARRVAELEKRAAAKPAAKPAASSRSSAASRSSGTKARKAPAKPTAARKAPAKPTAARTAAASTGPKPRPAAGRRRPPASGGA